MQGWHWVVVALVIIWFPIGFTLVAIPEAIRTPDGNIMPLISPQQGWYYTLKFFGVF